MNDLSHDAGADAESSSDATALHLSVEAARVIGCLLEKQATTPDHYPLTLNALVSACNQRSNRDPVVSFEPSVVEQTMEDLRYSGLGILVHQAGARVAKFKHTLENKLPYLTEAQQALICVLLLRGQQTSGELRQRCERMHAFRDVTTVEAALDSLIDYDPLPLVKKFPAGGGRRVPSYAHLLSGDPSPANSSVVATLPPSASPSASDQIIDSPTWRETLENRVEELETEVASLKALLEQLRSDLGA
jgi:uncharacterized protein YceH (UPF0502 family)